MHLTGFARWTLALCALGLNFLAGMSSAEESPEPTTHVSASLKDNPLGSFYAALRARYELADDELRQHSSALTLRTALGFGSRRFHGFSFLSEGESVLAVREDLFFDGVEAPNGRIVVPDPESLELNQLYVDYQSPWRGTSVRVGRQRMQIDDQRFVGNIGWRQHEMTMDAVRLTSDLGLDDLRLVYAYIEDVRRPFDNRGGPATRDFESNSHVVRLAYSRFPWARFVFFAYLFDFENAPTASSQTYGLRIVGERELSSALAFRYQLSYAQQADFGTNRRDVDANYQLVRGTLDADGIGAVTLGFERLGSDAGRAVFVTPLSTVHVFNGTADVFIDNGGPRGLRDAFVEITPQLGGRFRGSAAFHWFEADQGAAGLGWEVDASLSRPVTRWANLLLKGAYFHGLTPARPDTFRLWLQASFFF